MTRTQEQLPAGIEVRAGSPADCEAIKSFIAGLSLRARFLRFFTPASPPTPAVLRGLCGGGRTTDVLVATAGGAVIGHATADGSPTSGWWWPTAGSTMASARTCWAG